MIFKIHPIAATYPLILGMLCMPLRVEAGQSCGSMEGYFNTFASTFLVPDYFPPETEILKGLVSDADFNRCARISFAALHKSCSIHDNCYGDQSPKEYCDQSLLQGWKDSCQETYQGFSFDSLVCRYSCEVFVTLMAEAQTFDDGDFCPSCDAYKKAGESK